MPRYRFRNDATGVEVVYDMPADEFASRCKDGKLRIKNRMFGGTTMLNYVSGSGPATFGTYTACWPCESDNLGINPIQIPDAMAEDRRIGVGDVEYNPDTGCPIFTSNRQRTRYAEAHGFMELCAAGPNGPKALDSREREIRAMAGKSVRKCDDQ